MELGNKHRHFYVYFRLRNKIHKYQQKQHIQGAFGNETISTNKILHEDINIIGFLH